MLRFGSSRKDHAKEAYCSCLVKLLESLQAESFDLTFSKVMGNSQFQTPARLLTLKYLLCHARAGVSNASCPHSRREIDLLVAIYTRIASQ